MSETTSVHYYNATNPTADPNNSWALKLETLYSVAQKGRRIKVYEPNGIEFPESFVVQLSSNGWPMAMLETPIPEFPVIWPRGTTSTRAWAHVEDLARIGSVAATIELGYAEIALGTEKQELRKLAALVTALRCAASRALDRECINVWRPSHEMAMYHDGKLAMLRISKSSVNRLLASTLDHREKVAMDYGEVAKFGAYFVAMGAMARIGGGRHAMAMGESRFAVSLLADALGSEWAFLTRDIYIRDALLSEVWKAFPENTGDVINSDIIGQEVVSRCMLKEADLMAASVLRESEYRARTARTPKRHAVVARTTVHAPVQLEYSPVQSEAGDTEALNSPAMSYADIPFTPMPLPATRLSPLNTPIYVRPDAVWSPAARQQMDSTMRAEHSKSIGVSPVQMTTGLFGNASDEPPPLVD